MKITPDIQAKIDVVREYVEEHGQIWSRKVLYKLVSAGLVKDTSKSQYIQVCKLFMKLRRDGNIPYEWFRDKKTVVKGEGIRESLSFDKTFELTCKYFSKDSKSLQDNYVEVWTEKELPDTVKAIISKYEVGLLTSEGFVGDIPQYLASKRLLKIRDKYKIPIKIIYVTDYDCEGEHIFRLMKKRFEEYEGIEVKKIVIRKDHIKQFDLISNLGYRERMSQPRILKFHRNKEYVRDFFDKNTDLAQDGIVQYELDAYPENDLIALMERVLSGYIDLEIIENTEEICKKEVKEWLDKHYK